MCLDLPCYLLVLARVRSVACVNHAACCVLQRCGRTPQRAPDACRKVTCVWVCVVRNHIYLLLLNAPGLARSLARLSWSCAAWKLRRGLTRGSLLSSTRAALVRATFLVERHSAPLSERDRVRIRDRAHLARLLRVRPRPWTQGGRPGSPGGRPFFGSHHTSSMAAPMIIEPRHSPPRWCSASSVGLSESAQLLRSRRKVAGVRHFVSCHLREDRARKSAPCVRPPWPLAGRAARLAPPPSELRAQRAPGRR